MNNQSDGAGYDDIWLDGQWASDRLNRDLKSLQRWLIAIIIFFVVLCCTGGYLILERLS